MQGFAIVLTADQGSFSFRKSHPVVPAKERHPVLDTGREPRTSLQHETLDSGLRRNDEILEIWENRKTLTADNRPFLA